MEAVRLPRAHWYASDDRNSFTSAVVSDNWAVSTALRVVVSALEPLWGLPPSTCPNFCGGILAPAEAGCATLTSDQSSAQSQAPIDLPSHRVQRLKLRAGLPPRCGASPGALLGARTVLLDAQLGSAGGLATAASSRSVRARVSTSRALSDITCRLPLRERECSGKTAQGCLVAERRRHPAQCPVWSCVGVGRRGHEQRVRGASCCWSIRDRSWVTLPLLVLLVSPDTADCIRPTPVTAWKATSPPLMIAVAMIGIRDHHVAGNGLVEIAPW